MFAEFAQYSGDALEATAFQSMKQKGVSYENAFSELGLKYPNVVKEREYANFAKGKVLAKTSIQLVDNMAKQISAAMSIPYMDAVHLVYNKCPELDVY